MEKVFLWKRAGNHSELSNSIKLGSFLDSSLLCSSQEDFCGKVCSLLETLRWRYPLSTTRTTTNDRAHDLIFQLSESLSFYFIFFFFELYFMNCNWDLKLLVYHTHTRSKAIATCVFGKVDIYIYWKQFTLNKNEFICNLFYMCMCMFIYAYVSTCFPMSLPSN